ncbi:FecR domain-containing protein [bacterium]|nr:FecR domain-containing protein [bacterium]
MKKGFSLIETMILCFIGVVLLTLVIGLVENSREFARTMGCVNNMKNIVQAIENYQVDWRETPPLLENLYPAYITNYNTFHCPADREPGNSYAKFYVSRFFAEEDANKIFLACPRHSRRTKTVVAYLSYAVDIGKTHKVYWSGIPAEIGGTYTGGQLQFADGTVVDINASCEVGILGSFTDNQDRIYSIIYIPEGEDASITVTHQGDSEFEVITPAVIAGVEGTRFEVKNYWENTTPPSCSTEVRVFEGKVKIKERSQGRKFILREGKKLFVKVRRWIKKLREKPPRRPPKCRPHIWQREVF